MHITRSLLIFLAVASCLHAAEPPLPPDVASLAAGNTAFACDLYAQLKTPPGNLFFSPYSVSAALAMTFAGARGETAAQMTTALHFALPQGELHPAFAALIEELSALESSGHVKLSIANSLWPDRAYPFLERYLALVKTNYGVVITPVDYAHAEERARAQINQWVEDKTQKKIANLFASPLDPLTRLVLVNAVYFKGTWAHPFKKEQTRDAPFYRPSGEPAQTPMMMQLQAVPYGESDKIQIIELPYAGNELSMLVLLPRDTNTLAETESSLSAGQLQHWRQLLTEQKVQLFLPKFKLAWGTCSLTKSLQALGMTDAFGTAADFSGMDGRRHNLRISDVVQKAFVDVNEEGTEAAAATGVTIMAMSVAMQRPPPVFRADHPFLFLIQENHTGSILFMGRIMDPRSP